MQFLPYSIILLNIFQELKSFSHETKLEVKQIQSKWDEELRRLGENLVLVLILVYNSGSKKKTIQFIFFMFVENTSSYTFR